MQDKEYMALIGLMEDGIYFGLDDKDYFALERFSASGAAAMLISPATFWAQSWLNPVKVQEREEEAEKVTAAQIAGKAYHRARLEPEIYQRTYVRSINPAEYPGILTTHTAIKEQLKELGEAQTKTGENVLGAAYRLRATGYDKPILHILEDQLRSDMEEHQIEVSWMLFDQIAADMAAMHGNREVAPHVTNGQSEVTILWTDKAGVKWKARLDYLQARSITDVKTFANARGKELEQCIYDDIAYNRYYMQAHVYWTAAELIRTSDLQIKKMQNQAQQDLIDAIRASEDPFEYWWIFQEKGGVPNVLARKLRLTAEVHPHYLAAAPTPETRKALQKKLQRPSMIWKKAELEVRAARDRFVSHQEIYPRGEPWGAMVPVAEIDDEGFNRFWLEK